VDPVTKIVSGKRIKAPPRHVLETCGNVPIRSMPQFYPFTFCDGLVHQKDTKKCPPNYSLCGIRVRSGDDYSGIL